MSSASPRRSLSLESFTPDGTIPLAPLPLNALVKQVREATATSHQPGDRRPEQDHAVARLLEMFWVKRAFGRS
jgi:hypothetical protein